MTDERDPHFEARFQDRYAAAERDSAKLEGPSLAQRLVALGREDADRVLNLLSPAERAALLYSWGFWGRPKQFVPHRPHRVAMWMAGRGFGKNAAGAQRVRQRIYDGAKSIAIIGSTLSEVKRYQVGGKPGGPGSGLLDVFPPKERAEIEFKEQKGEIVFHQFGATAYLSSDEQPEVRGPGFDTAWLDEIIKWKYLRKLWENLEFAMRLRSAVPVEIIVTTSPRAIRFLKELVADPDTITICGETDENEANLDPGYIPRLQKRFGGSRLAEQERKGRILTRNERALFDQEVFDEHRFTELPPLRRIVIAIDPAIATNPENDETGIVALGITHDGIVVVLEDASGRHSPEEWSNRAIDLYDKWEADAFVAERNRGGDLVASTIRAAIRERKGRHAVARVIEVHATRNKEIRAEPVSVLAEQKRLRMFGSHPEVESELTTWDPTIGGPSPNRLDAVVWGAYDLAELGEDKERRTTGEDIERAHAVMQTARPRKPGEVGAFPRRSGGRRL